MTASPASKDPRCGVVYRLTPEGPAAAPPASEAPSLLALAQRCALHGETHELERARIERYRRQLQQAALAQLGGVREDLLVGDFSRGSAPRPFTHLDLLLVLDDAAHFKHLATGPQGLLGALRTALLRVRGARLLPETTAPPGAVHVLFEHGALGFQVRPAYREPYVLGGLTIPARSGEAWIRVNPGALTALHQQVEARFGPLLKPALRLAKRWSLQAPEPLSTLHLEVLALAGCARARPPTDLLDALARILRSVQRGLHERAAALVPAAAQIHEDIDAALTVAARCELRERFGQAATDLERARSAESLPADAASERALQAVRAWLTRGLPGA